MTEYKKTPIEGVLLIEPATYFDERGHFLEMWSRTQFERMKLSYDFTQDNCSFSKKGVLRGLHFQYPPHAQAKLVRCSSGAVYDVAVDLRSNSPTYGQYTSAVLSSENRRMLLIPEGCAHGFLSLDDAHFCYKVTGTYQIEYEGGIRYDDPSINIKWPFDPLIVSQKDQALGWFKFINPYNKNAINI